MTRWTFPSTGNVHPRCHPRSPPTFRITFAELYQESRVLWITVIQGGTVTEQRARDLAWAEALVGLARVAATLSTRLRAIHADTAGDGLGEDREGGRATEVTAAVSRVPRGGLGPRQEAVLALGGLDAEPGMTTGEIATAVGSARTNTHKLLVRLEDLGALERMPDERPARWRRAVA